MAEVAGLAAGVISLGLQVTQYIVNYVGAMRGRQEDLLSAKRRARDLDLILRAYEQFLTQGRTQSLPQTSIDCLESCIKSCEPELKALNALLSDIAGSKSSHPSFKEKLIDRAQRLSYPFRKGHLEDLQERMSRVIMTLQAGANAVGIAAQQAMSTQLQIVSQQTDAVRSDVAAIGTPIESIQAGIAEIQSLLQHMVFQEENRAATATAERRVVETIPASSPDPSLFDSFCTCPRTRRRSRQTTKWGPLWTYSDKSTLSYHLPNCPLRLVRRDETSSSFGIYFTGIASWLKRVVEVSFSQSPAAGGFALSPSIAYRATVDAETAPAFRMLAITHNAIASRGQALGPNALVDIFRRKLLALFMCGKARATDVDTTNSTLMHYAAYMLWEAIWAVGTDAEIAAVKQLVTLLLDAGVPSESQDIEGSTPFLHNYDIAHLVWPAGRELPDFASGARSVIEPHPIMTGNFIKGAVENMEFAEAWGCGPLSMAMLAKDDARVRELVESNKSILTEKNDYGLPVILLAAYHFPRCVPFLISTAKDFIPFDDFTPRASVITFALAGSEQHEHSSDQNIQCDSGAAITALFLLREWEVDYGYLARACHHCQVALARHMVSEREYLKELAFRVLPRHQLSDIDRNSVLDVKSHRVLQLVRQAGVAHPIPLSRISIPEADQLAGTSVYSDILDATTADIFYRQGFRDTNLSFPRYPEYSGPQLTFEYARWLLEHGRPPREGVEVIECRHGEAVQSKMIPFARFVLESMGDDMLVWVSNTEDTDREDYLKRYRQCLGGLIPYDVRDQCRCECSFGMGCGLVAHLLRKCMTDWQSLSTDELQGFLLLLCEECGEFIDRDNIRDLVRLVTFQKLDMTHTCCLNGRFSSYDDSENENHSSDYDDDDDIQEIWEEEKQLILELNKLTLEFEQHESRSLKDFWTRYWPRRVHQTIASMNGKDITEKEIAEAEDIGVVWGMQSGDKVPQREIVTLEDFEAALDAVVL